MKRRCSNCKFWSPYSTGDSVQPFKDFCKAHPQKIEKTANDWCGEFRPRDEAAAPQQERMWLVKIGTMRNYTDESKSLHYWSQVTCDHPDAELWEKVGGQGGENSQ